MQTASIPSVKITILPNSLPRGSYLHSVDQNYVTWPSIVKRYSDSTTSVLETGIGKEDWDWCCVIQPAESDLDPSLSL